MRPSLYRNARNKTALDFGPGGGRNPGGENLILMSAKILELDSFAIESDFKRVRMFQSADLFDGVGPQLWPDLVLPVDREVVLNHHASARPQRQAFDVVPLRQIHSRNKSLCRRRDLRAT